MSRRPVFSSGSHTRAFKALAFSAFVMLIGTLAAYGGGNSPNSSVSGAGAALFAPQPAVAQTTAWALNQPFGLPNTVDATQTPHIYVPNFGNNTVTTYTLNGTQTTPTITRGVSAPDGLAVDTAGKIYVANSGNNTVTSYTANGTQTTPTITNGINRPTDVAVDAAGKIYVANYGNNTVTTYTPNGTRTTPTIAGLNGPQGMAVDAAGKIYVTNSNTSTVTSYTAKGTQTTPTITQGLSFPNGLAVDAAGKIYVTNSKGGTVTTYTPNGTRTTPTINKGLNFPQGVAVDTAGKVYVANRTNSVTTYTANGTQTTPTITQGLSNPARLKIAPPPAQPPQYVYALNQSSEPTRKANITVYPVTASGNVKPTRTIVGSKAIYNGGFGLDAVDSAGYLYVSYDGGNAPKGQVFIYAPGANGNSPPVRTITVNIRGFLPRGLAIDNSRHELYVSDFSDNVIYVFDSGPSGPSGTVTPKRSISGSKTGIASPQGIAYDSSSGELYVLSQYGKQYTDVFSQGASGNATPVRIIPHYLYFPYGAAVGPLTRDFYEVDTGDSSVNVFSPTATGPSPLRRIQGANTKNFYAEGVALDSSENVYVSNLFASKSHSNNAGSINVFQRGANGNPAPIRSIVGSNTGLGNTTGIAIGP